MPDKDQFIDAESDYSENKNSYEDILLRQIKKTADSLSVSFTKSSSVITKPTKTVSAPFDAREIAINHVKTLRGLMQPFFRKFKKNLEQIDKDIENYLKEEGNKKIFVPGQGEKKVKDIVHHTDSLTYHRYLEFLVEKHREIFDVLVLAYHKSKAEIAALSYE